MRRILLLIGLLCAYSYSLISQSESPLSSDRSVTFFHPEVAGWQVYSQGSGMTYHSPFPWKSYFNNRPEGGVSISLTENLDALDKNNAGTMEAEMLSLGITWSDRIKSFSIGHRIRYLSLIHI